MTRIIAKETTLNASNRMKLRIFIDRLMRTVMLTLALLTTTTGLASQACHGLRANVFRHDISDEGDVQIEFVLENKSTDCLDTGPWLIFIDGKNSWRANMIFGNGPGPSERRDGVLKAGQTYDFSVNLPMNDLFPRPHTHKLYWKGKHFKSNTISIAPLTVK